MATSVLLVASGRDGLRTRLCARLTDDGFDVTICPGPCGPSFLCPGARGHCPFCAGNDAVVLDLWLDSDVARRGVPSWHLLRLYRDAGLPVVALMGPDGLPAPVYDDGVVTLPRDATEQEVSEAVRSVTRAAANASIS